MRRDVGAPAPPASALLLAYAGVLPAVAAAAWVLAALPLVALHAYRPVPQTLAAAVLAIALGRPALRVARARAEAFGRLSWLVPAGVVLVVVAFGVLAYATSTGDVLVRRDPGSYAMSATWLAGHGGVQMPSAAAAFGGPHRDLLLASQGFYVQGSHIVPQFMTGVPALLAVGGWFAGVAGVLHANAFVGALALLAFAGLVARLVGPGWAVPATAVLALVQPELDFVRGTYSEPAAQLLTLGGLAMLLDAVAAARAAASRDTRSAMLVAGVVLGAASVVRIDAPVVVAPLVPFLGWLALRGLPWRPLAAGLAVGLGAGAFDAVVLTLPYVQHTARGLVLTAVLYALVVPATLGWVRLARGDGRAMRAFRRCAAARPMLAAAALGAVAFFFVVRPYLTTTRSAPSSGTAYYVQQVQRILHLPVDPTRTYYEQSLRWVTWYVGWGTLVLALVGAIVLARAMAEGRRLEWLPVFLVCLATTLVLLYWPGITPDHPWADRRFVPIVYPALVLLAVEALRLAAHAAPPPLFRAAIAGIGAAAIGVPTVVGSAAVLGTRTEQGEVGLVQRACAQLRPTDVVMAFGDRGATEWPATLRVMCGVPAAYLAGRPGDDGLLLRIEDAVHRRGGRLMVLVADQGDRQLVPLAVDWTAQPTLHLETTELAHTLVRRPDAAASLPVDVWLAPAGG